MTLDQMADLIRDGFRRLTPDQRRLMTYEHLLAQLQAIGDLRKEPRPS
jgi:hypothetical protein